MTNICIYNAHMWVSNSLLVINMSCPQGIPWHDICCVHPNQLVMNFLQCDTLHMRSQVTLHTSTLMMFPVGLPSVNSGCGDTTLLLVLYHGCRQSTVCPLHSEIRSQMMLFNMGYAVSLFFETSFCFCLMVWWGSVGKVWHIYEWIQFMAGSAWHMTGGVVHGWDSAAYDSGFS